MTTPNTEPVRKIADPAIILDQIENRQDSTPRHEVGTRDSSSPNLRVVHAGREVFDDFLDQPLEVPPQIAELTGHLKRRRDALLAKEEDLNEKIASWQTSIDASRAANSDQERRLLLREQQLKSLQFHLLQMQNDVIDSQVSMESIIEHFENTESDDYLKVALEMLRFEVLERFEYISRRWEMLHGKLEQMYSENTSRKAA